MKTVFLDSSVLFTAVNSPTGGSSKLFTFKNIQLKTSKIVLVEVERNVREKLQTYHLERFFMLVAHIIIVSQKPNQKLINEANNVIAEKDAVILAEAKQAKTDFLVSLDRKHFLTKEATDFLKPKEIVTPKILIQSLKK